MEAEKGKKEKYSWVMERATDKNLGLRERPQFQGQGFQAQYHFILQLVNNRVIPW